MELAAAVVFAVNAVGGMQINRPAAVGHCVVMVALLNNIFLAEHMVANKSAAFAFTRN
ncbi:hypothetical protein D3C75_1216810 [compost metagenome]